MTLTTRQRRFLRGMTHSLQPVVMVGEKGLTENVMTEIERALDQHELVKIKLRSDRETRARWIQEIGDACGAEKVHAIGQVVCFYRENPDQAVIILEG